MKHIVVNGRFLTQKTTGVQRYAREILLELDKIIQPAEISIAVPPEAKEIPNYKNIEVVRIGKLHGNLWEQISFALYCLFGGFTPLNLCNSSPLLIPGIVAIHDVKIKAHPEFFSKKFLAWYKLQFKNSTKKAKKIITVSQFSKDEIVKYYKVLENKIAVINNGWQHFNRTDFDEKALKTYNLEKNNYYFAVSSLDPNKNFKWIAEKAKQMPNETFAISGSINSRVFSNNLGFECPGNMKLLGFASDGEAKTLMRDCKAFLFPSIYEGFGIPPLEAMSTGCKNIVVADTKVMHEIFEDSVTYMDEKIELNNIKETYSDKILKKYSWENSAKQLKEVLFNE